jgi:hypothetical protein
MKGKTIYIIRMISILLSVLSVACNHDTDGSLGTGKIRVTILARGLGERSVFPLLPESVNDITSFELVGKMSDTEDEINYAFETLPATVALVAGTWDFTLKAYKDNKLVLQGVNRGFTVSASSGALEFELMSIAEGKGSINMTIELPPASGVSSVITTVEDEVVTPPLPIADNKIVYSKSDVDAGDYFIHFKLCDNNGKIMATVTELVIVRMNLSSAKTIVLESNDLNTAPRNPPGNLYGAIIERTDTTITFRFQWDDNSNNETGFVLSDGNLDYTISAGSTTYELGPIAINNPAPAYKIKAVNDFGASEWTWVYPLVPTELSAAAISSGSIDISWLGLWANKYRIQRSSSTDSDVIFDVIKGEHDTMAYTDSDLTEASIYYYKVQAINAVGESELSSVVSAITLLPTPQGLVVARRAINSLVLSWPQVSGAAWYNVYYNTSDSFNTATQFSPLQPITNTQCTVTGLNAKTVYYLWLTAHDDKTYSEPSLSTESGTIDSSITTDFKNPADPVLLLNGGTMPDNIKISQIQYDSYVISVKADGWVISKWLLDGIAATTNDSYTIDWQIRVGPHILTLIVTKNGVPYSTSINFTVVNR